MRRNSFPTTGRENPPDFTGITPTQARRILEEADRGMRPIEDKEEAVRVLKEAGWNIEPVHSPTR
jgi:hypothetical protein